MIIAGFIRGPKRAWRALAGGVILIGPWACAAAVPRRPPRGR